ncbi:MAG: histidinol dehydrogenase [Chloroflexota bacterium]|jgi:histidinol dehydrogenase
MLRIMDVTEAQETILRRELSLEPANPELLRPAMERIFGEALTPGQAVARIAADVLRRGDQALSHWTERIDGVALDRFAVDPQAIAAAPARIAPELLQALETAARRIRAFHECQPVRSWTTDTLGGRLGQRVAPIQRAGVYVPGGTAPLPSSLLMSVIPAQVAGVPDIIVTTPPRVDGSVPDVILAAAHTAGVERIYTLGGAQAVAALAYGTESIPRVDKIVGAGNLFVTLAKREVYGQVGIDGLYGPTETMVIADDTADPRWVAADLLAQAEHDVLATAILLTPSARLARAVQAAVANQIEALSRADIIAVSLANQSGIVLCDDLDQAARLANDFAPEHLCISTANAQAVSGQINNAGGLFLGERSFEVLGDYIAGPSHVMPTGRSARFSSPLNVLDFVKFISIIELDEATSAELCPVAARIAQAEKLTAHAQAALVRS